MSVGDGNINGQFFVKKGQGLSQAIAEELNLKPDEIKQIDGKTWKSIFQKVDEQQQKNIEDGKGKVYTGGNTWNGSGTGNYVVQVNQAVSFSKEIWADIVGLVSAKLGKEIKIGEQDENFGATNTQGNRGAQNANGTNDSGATDTPEEVVAEEMEQQIKADAENVKVTVTNEAKTFYEEERAHAQDLAKTLKEVLTAEGMIDMKRAKDLLSRITQDTVAYVLEAYPELATDIDEVFRMGFGFDKDEVYQYLLKPLLERAKSLELSYTYDGKDITVENAKDLSLKEMKVVLEYVTPEVIQGTVERIASKEEQIPQIQQTFDEANNFLAEVANMTDKQIRRGTKEDGKGYAECTLPDGRRIKVHYTESGEVEQIDISYDTTPYTKADGTSKDGDEIRYRKDKAFYDIDISNGIFEGSIRTGYDFEKLKALVEKIFGKKTVEE